MYIHTHTNIHICITVPSYIQWDIIVRNCNVCLHIYNICIHNSNMHFAVECTNSTKHIRIYNSCL